MIFTPRNSCLSAVMAEIRALGIPFASHNDVAGFRLWFNAAWLRAGCTQNFLVLKQPANSVGIQFYQETRATTEVWWWDGSANSYVSGNTVTHDYSSGEDRAVVILGALTLLQSNESNGRTSFSVRLSPMRSLNTAFLYGSSEVTGGVANLTNLTLLSFGTGAPTGIPEIAASNPKLAVLEVGGATTLTSEQVNAILASVWANRDHPKAGIYRAVQLRGAQVAPATGQGLVDAANLRAYRSPNMDPAAPFWTVNLN